MRLTPMLLVLAMPSLAQNAWFVDLAGPWKIYAGDNPRYAEPAWDDGDWRVVALPAPDQSLPRVSYPVREGANEFTWLRRSVTVPESMAAQPLVLTLGLVADNYEVYVNGQKAGSAGSLSEEGATAARSRSFSLRAGMLHPGTNVLAIRVGGMGPAHLARRASSFPDEGPYTLSDEASAPRKVAAHSLDERLRGVTLRFLGGAISCVLGLIVLLLWLGDRQQRPLLYLACFLLLGGWSRLGEYLSVLLNSSRDWLAAPTLFLQAIPLAYFALDILRSRALWLRYLIWLGSLGAVAAKVAGFEETRLWSASLYLLLAWSFYAFVANRSRDQESRLLPLGAILLIFLFIQRVGLYQIVRISFYAEPFWWNLYDVFVPILSLPLIGLLLRQLATDRQEKQRLDSELAAARAVQQLLLSSPADQVSSYAVETAYEPAREVGGDFYQVYDHADGVRIVVMGDVSGKGLKAAMLVAVALGALRRETSSSPAAILSGLNDALIGHAGGGFVTCCAIHFGLEGIRIASAGHIPPYLDGREIELEPGLPLGMVRDVRYSESAIILARDSQLTIVSDGVVEAENAQRELFGFDRTREISGKSPQEIAEAAKAWGQNDDITVVTVRRNA